MFRSLVSTRRSALRLRRLAGVLSLACLTCLVVLGPQMDSAAAVDWFDWKLFRSQSPDDPAPEKEERQVRSGTSLATPYVGEYITSFGGTSLVLVQGVGLVVNLENTGEDPPPTHHRTMLVDEMRKQGIDDPNTLLKRPDTALVLIKGYIPVNSRVGDKLDVHVTLPPNSAATSLAGGYLVEARLSEYRTTQGGRLLAGDVLATASGPILTSVSIDSSARGNLRSGKVLGGMKSRMTRDLSITLRSEFRSGRNTMRVAEAIGNRFHGHDKNGIKVPMAEAKDDQYIELKVPEQYRENYPRYLAVIRNLAFRESEIALRVRMQKLEEQLNTPAESETAAMRLEAIGTPAAPILKRSLSHKDIEVRFNAAIALSYMGFTEGLETLAEAARDEPAFRVYALAALACCKEAEAAVALYKLLPNETAETRYGAFRALTVLNDRDPIVAGVPMTGNEKVPTYMLHVLDVEGPPLVHATHHTKAEIVLFGARQQLQMPAALRCGPYIQVVSTPGSNEVVVARYRGKHAGRKVVSPNLAEVIAACDSLGATYPDVVTMLMQAEAQYNLPGQLEIDALPEAGRTYVPSDPKASKRTIGNKYTAPNILAPPTSEAAAERDSDLDAVPAQPQSVTRAEKTSPAKTDPAVTPASGEDEAAAESGVMTADYEVPAEESRASKKPAELPQNASEASPLETSAGSNGSKWYDPRQFFGKIGNAVGGGPPVQSEPGAE